MSLFEKFKSYMNERELWLMYGKPYRDPLTIERLFKACENCPERNFLRLSETKGRCKLCGCFLRKHGHLANKLAWATTECPIGEWEEEAGLDEILPMVAEKRRIAASRHKERKRSCCG